MSRAPKSSSALAMVQSELFKSQMAALAKKDRERIWRSLSRLHAGLPTPGVENRWGGDWLLWPCGDRQVLYRALTAEEVAIECGTPGEGVLLYGIEPPVY